MREDDVGRELRIVASKERRVLCRSVRENELTEEKRAVFLEALGENCNVRLAAAEAGACRSNFYKLRRRDPAFAAAWDEAMEQGYDELESELLAKALGDESVDQRLHLETAMAMLTRRDKQLRSGGHGGRVKVVRVPIEQVEATLIKRLAAVARRLEAGAPQPVLPPADAGEER